MRAAVVETFGGPENIGVQHVSDVRPGAGIVSDVQFAGVSFPDLLMVLGQYQTLPSLPFTPGLEVAGTVRTAPHGSGLIPGRRVVGLTTPGGWAEQVECSVDTVFPLPDGLSFVDAAAVLMNYLTAHYALARRARLERGEVVLVHGAVGGVGSAAVQLAKAAGARVVAVVSAADRMAAALSVGANDVVLAGHWADDVRALL